MKTRKHNRLSEFNYNSSGAYFITICTKDKEKILCNIVGDGALDVPQVELTNTGRIVDKYIRSSDRIKNINIDKYVIMPNHIHLLISITGDIRDVEAPSPTNALIPGTISALKRLSNSEAGVDIFQRSFYDHIIRNKYDYDAVWQYIDENPLKWQSDPLNL